MIDGESSKAELLQKVLIWRYDCSYSDVYLILIVLISHNKTREAEGGRLYNYTDKIIEVFIG